MRHLYKFILLVPLTAFKGNAQPYDTIKVGYSTSVNLIFSSTVKKWDMGLGTKIENGMEVRDVLVENTADSPERIKLAAGVENFETTNLFVETGDGYYNFILKYDDRPEILLIEISPGKASITKQKIEMTASHAGKRVIDSLAFMESLKNICEKIRGMSPDVTNVGQVSQKMLFYVGGIYITGEYLFFRIYIKNGGNIPYDIGFTGFFRGDKGKRGNKRRPSQIEMLSPLYIDNEERASVKNGEVVEKVYVLQKFTLSKAQKLYIQFWEGNQGERKVELILGSQDILKAKKI